MIIQISLAIIAIALVTFVCFQISVMVKVRKAIENIQADIHLLSIESSGLISRFSELTEDLTQKSKSLNFLFTPLTYLHHEKSEESSSEDKTLPQFVNWVATSLILVKKSKEFIKKYVK